MLPEKDLASMCTKGFRVNRSRDSANRRVQVMFTESRKMKTAGGVPGPDRFSTVPDAIENVVNWFMGQLAIKWHKFIYMK